jgi:hypothetical protein
MGDIFLKDWKAWRILTKTFPQYVSHKIPEQRIFIHTTLLSDAGMAETNLSKIVNSRQNFHKIRKQAVSSRSVLEDWAHILRSVPTNSKLAKVDFWSGKFEGLREIYFSSEEMQQFSEIFHLGVSGIAIDYHPWRYHDKHTIWITADEIAPETIEQLINLSSTFSFFSFYNYVSYPTPIILCEKHMVNSYLPKLAYLPRYKIRSDLTVELTPPKIWIRSLVAEVIYESLLLITDIWKMSRDRFARGRINDLVDGQIPGLILLLSHKVFVGNISDIQKKFKELYPDHPLWNLQAEIRRARPDIIQVQNLFPPVLEELRRALVQNDI